MKDWIFDLQLFAEAGTLVNALGGYMNAYTGAKTDFDSDNDLSTLSKVFCDTALLDRCSSSARALSETPSSLSRVSRHTA